MKAKIFLLFVLVLFSFYSVNAGAEITPGTFTFGLNQGFYTFEGSQDLENTVPMGLGLGFDFTRHFGLEYYYNWGDTKTEPAGDEVDFEFYRLEALGYFNSWKGIIPYLAVGAGALNLDRPGRKVGDSVIDFGLGLKYFLTDNVAFRTDIRSVMPLPEHNYFFTVGLTYHFGKKAEQITEKAPAYQPEPEPAPPADSDGDGVTDDMDQCPDTPKGIKVDSKGCPLDSDGDGVTDDMDQCPDTPKGTEVDNKGCPVPVDSDGDGVYDDTDRCPNTPKGATVDSRGCWTLRNLKFDTNKAVIKGDGAMILDEVVGVLEKNDTLNVEIDGHTDNVGSEKYNQQLSEKRANAVMEYFVSKGISQGRLSAKGFGESKPAASNDTEEGRAENRRVELTPVQ